MKNNEVYKIALKVSKMGPTWNLFGLVDEAKKSVANYTNSVGVDMIAEERQRQIDQEGWTEEHDDKYVNEELSLAAASYAVAADGRERYKQNTLYIHVRELLIRDVDPYRIIEKLIEINDEQFEKLCDVMPFVSPTMLFIKNKRVHPFSRYTFDNLFNYKIISYGIFF